ncbi:hypothetical protein [Chamaesiphon sp.]|uniref:hypothetical protein n=1 Tax=Chamaesiphon sp. TaxID=2814140 RepID=UPI003593FC86
MRHYNRSRRANLFTQNLLWIGYWAWQGYLNIERGVVVISSEVDLLDDSDPYCGDRLDPSLNFRYIPQAQLAIYLQEWLVDRQEIDPILTAVASYQPQTELIFAIEFSANLDLGWCQRLQVSPPDCHQQICRRWSEFELGFRL